MTDDELLALARRATFADLPPSDVHGRLNALYAFRCAFTPTTITTMIERHRVEIERLTQERDEARSWNKLYDREPNEARKKAIALRAAKWELGCCCQFDENDEQIIWCAPHADLKQRAEAAESALAAAQKRVGVLQNVVGETLAALDKLDPLQAVLPVQQANLRAALAGGTAGR